MKKTDLDFLKTEPMEPEQLFGILEITHFAGFQNAIADSLQRGCLPNFLQTLQNISNNGKCLVKLCWRSKNLITWVRFIQAHTFTDEYRLDWIHRQLLSRLGNLTEVLVAIREAKTTRDLKPLYENLFGVDPSDWLFSMNGALIYSPIRNQWESST